MFNYLKPRKSAIQKFINTAAESGTAKDKAAALTLKIQSNPIGNHKVLEQLLKTCKKKVRREFIMAGNLLKDVFIADLLPDNRTLYYFHERSDLILAATKDLDSVWSWDTF